MFCSTPSFSQDETAGNSMAEFCKNLPRPEYAELEKREQSTDWFEVYQVAEGVTAIYEPYQWQEVISYLIEGEDQALLFDSGNGIGDIKSIVQSLTTKPVSVLNSHGHYDHVGGNYQFQTIYGLQTEFSKQRQQGHLNADIAIEVSAHALCRALPEGVTEKSHVGQPYKITHPVEDGDVIDLGGRRVEIIHIAGHTPDSIALIDREARLMWTGDSYYSGPIWLFAPETDFTAYEQSLQRLVKEIPKVDSLLPAHNTPLAKPSLLASTLQQFKKMKRGELVKRDLGDGFTEYQTSTPQPFSFLLATDNEFGAE